MSKVKEILGDIFQDMFTPSYRDKLGEEMEWQYLDEKCLVKPLKHEENEFMSRFSALSESDKIKAILESKKWGDFYITNKMQQSV